MKLNILSVTRPQTSDILTRVSVNESGMEVKGESRVYGVSADGRGIVMETGVNFDPNDNNNSSTDIYYKDLVTGKLTWITAPQTSGIFGFSGYQPQLSPNGRFVMFSTEATNLDPNDKNDDKDIYIKDLATGSVSRLTPPVGPAAFDGSSAGARFSPDGNSIVFESDSDNLGPEDGNFLTDIYIKNLVTGAVTRVTTTSKDDTGGHSYSPQFTPDGKSVVFESGANHIVDDDSNGTTDIFIKNWVTGTIELLSREGSIKASAPCQNAVVSPDGRYVLFETKGTDFEGNDSNNAKDLFIKDLASGTISRLSSTKEGIAGNGGSYSNGARFSPDGRYVIFESDASDLVAGDLNGARDVFRKDLVTGEITRMSVATDGAEGNNSSYDGMYSQDGRYFLFSSDSSNFVANDKNNSFDVFRIDLLYQANATAIAENRFVDVKLDVGTASSASIAWGDGATNTVTPVAGNAAFSHAYASTGSKGATVTLVDGALTWKVAHTLDVVSSTMARNTKIADTISGGAGRDKITGDIYANILVGNGGNDNLSASSGNDRLTGGTGQDTLTGGSGRDVFIFDDRETGSSKSRADYLSDFSGRRGDKIDLKLVDANSKKRSDQKFSFIGDEKTFSKAGEVRYEKTKGYTYVYLNTDSDKAAEAVIKIKGAMDLQKSWFVL